jgi:integrase
MGGVLKETRLTTKSARAALSKGLYWRSLDPNIHIGYRKGVRGGRWLVRCYKGAGKYLRLPIGVADDLVAVGTYSYDAACKRARALVADVRGKARRASHTLPETVGDAILRYVAIRDERLRQQRPGTKQRSDAASRLTKHVLGGSLAQVELTGLTEEVLVEWKEEVAPTLTAGSRVRTINDLKAALNLAYRRLRRSLPPDFSEVVKWGLSTENLLPAGYKKARENQILEDDDVRRIVEAAITYDDDGDIGRMVLMLAATGARFSQLQRLTVGDVQADRQRLFIPLSRKGQSKSDGHYPLRVGQDVIDALRPLLTGRSYDEPLLCRWRKKQVPRKANRGLIWVNDYRGPWTSSAEITRAWKEICASVSLAGTIPYALRHTSIVRAIRAGLPIRLVAAMHDTSVGMIERHYARYIVDGLEELTAKAIIPLTGPRLRVVA